MPDFHSKTFPFTNMYWVKTSTKTCFCQCLQILNISDSNTFSKLKVPLFYTLGFAASTCRVSCPHPGSKKVNLGLWLNWACASLLWLHPSSIKFICNFISVRIWIKISVWTDSTSAASKYQEATGRIDSAVLELVKYWADYKRSGRRTFLDLLFSQMA